MRRIQSEANQARAEAAKQGKVGRAAASKKEETKESLEVEQVVPPLKEHKTRQAKATASKTNRGTVERMDRLDPSKFHSKRFSEAFEGYRSWKSAQAKFEAVISYWNN